MSLGGACSDVIPVKAPTEMQTHHHLVDVAELRRSQTPRSFRSAVDSIGQVQRMIGDMPGPSGSFEAARTKPEPPHPGAIKATLVDPVGHKLPVESQP